MIPGCCAKPYGFIVMAQLGDPNEVQLESMWDVPLQHLFNIAREFYRKGETVG